MYRYGAGHNPAFLSPVRGSPIPFPAGIDLIEMGLAQLKYWHEWPGAPSNTAVSLHLSRSPICENDAAQDSFIEHLAVKTKGLSICSIGVHITGPRDSGIGIYGLSPHYDVSPVYEERAIRFIRRATERLGIPVWIENANFYSSDANEILASWASIRRICDATEARVIFDASHAVIDASNVGIAPEAVLGAVPWDRVVEIHLSGIVEGPDGALHDGHSLPVHAKTWGILKTCINGFIKPDQQIYLTIEHTEPTWVDAPDKLAADFVKVRTLVSQNTSTPKRAYTKESPGYARSYLKKLMRRYIPKLEPACAQRGVSFDALFNDWIKQRVEIDGMRICITQDELAPGEETNNVVAAPDFLKFALARLGS